MATQAKAGRDVDREARFFLISAFVMAATIVAGFSLNLALGRSSFAVPIVYHVHAFIFFGWMALYLTQNMLIAGGSVALHRRLGWLAVAWIPAMAIAGTAMTVTSLRRTGSPFFFDKNEFLFGNTLVLYGFVALAAAAILMRRRTDWHRRLMLCAVASLTGPGFGRLLPMPFLIPWAWWSAAFFGPVLFVLAGMFYDLRMRGRVHPAYFWGFGTLLGLLLLADLIAYSPLGYMVTEWAVAGSPGAERPMAAFLPPGFQ